MTTATTTGERAEAAPSYWLIALIVGLIHMVLAADYQTVGVALLSMARGLKVTPAMASWLISAYALAYAGGLIAAGRAGDIFGARRCLFAGVALFASGVVLAGSGPDFALVVTGRVIQGFGSALLAPVSFALLNTTLPETLRVRAMGFFATMQGVGSLAGPLLGGWLTTNVSWRGVFLIGLPVMAAVCLLLLRLPPDRILSRDRKPFDLVGLVLVTSFSSLLLLAITGKSGASAGPTLLGGLAAGVALFFWVRRSANPIVPANLFRVRKFSVALVVLVLLISSTVAFTVLNSVAMQTGLGWTATRAGLGVLPFAIATIATGRIAPFVLQRWPMWKTMAASLGLTLAGLLTAIAAAPLHSYALSVAPSLVLCSSGIIMCWLALMSDALEGVPTDEQGGATGALLAVQQIAAAGGAAGVLAVVGRAATAAHGLLALRGAYGMIAALIFAALAVVLIARLRQPGRAAIAR